MHSFGQRTLSDLALLDNIFWHTMCGAHARYSEGGSVARRYGPGFSPIVAFADPQRPDFAALAPHCAAGEHFYCDGWSGVVEGAWQIDNEATMLKMVWDHTSPSDDAAPDAVPLDASHAAQALELTKLTRPGPFGLRTIELGDYFGVFENNRLIAMAGERTQSGRLREISGVCTHPDFQGRGLARQLMLKLIHRELQRGEIPFLHVMGNNKHACKLYERMGFHIYRESVVRVISLR